MAARAVVRDVARAQGKSYSLGDRIAKLIPFSPEMTLEKALNENKELKQILKLDEDASEIFDMALKLEGTARSVGKHAAGVVIAPSKINDYSPLYLDADTYDESVPQSYATQYSMEDIVQQISSRCNHLFGLSLYQCMHQHKQPQVRLASLLM